MKPEAKPEESSKRPFAGALQWRHCWLAPAALSHLICVSPRRLTAFRVIDGNVFI